MKLILVLLIIIAGAMWFFHGRTPRAPAAPSLDEAAAQAVAQAKQVAVEARQAVMGAAHIAQDGAVGTTPREALDRLLAGVKLHEQPRSRNTVEGAVVKGNDSSPYQRLLHGESIPEARNPNTPNLRK